MVSHVICPCIYLIIDKFVYNIDYIIFTPNIIIKKTIILQFFISIVKVYTLYLRI